MTDGATRLAAVSIDLDEVGCYTAIHGLPAPAGESAHAVYDRALPRFEVLLDELGIPATFFAIGADLARPAARDAIARLHRAGHEIGNHSHGHRYDLSRLDDEAIGEEIDRGAAAIEGATGERPVGFRAPGYTTGDRVLLSLSARGYRYDSSVFPCPAYYGAKAAALGAIRLSGRSSHSILDTPAVLRAPADPYRVGLPYYLRGAGLLQLPIGVTRDLTGRLPYIGTFLSLLGAKPLTHAIIGRPLVNLELHGIDLADPDADGIADLRAHQPDLRRSLAHRREQLVTSVTILRDAGYRFVTLRDAAAAF